MERILVRWGVGRGKRRRGNDLTAAMKGYEDDGGRLMFFRLYEFLFDDLGIANGV